MYESPQSPTPSGAPQQPPQPAWAPPMLPPAAQPATPAAGPTDQITERVAWSPSSNEAPVYAPAPPARAAGFSPAAAGGSTDSRSSDGGRRSVGPGFVLGAVLASALLASGGTYLAVQAADGNHTTPANASSVTPAAANSTPAPAGTSAPAANGTSAPAANG